MIAKVTGRGHSFKGATAYYMHDKERAKSSERVAWTLTGNMPTRDPNKAYKWMAYTAGEAERLKQEAGVKNTGRKSTKGEVYTFTLAGHPEDKGKYDFLHWEKQVLEALKIQGLDGHQWYAVGHNDTDHDHAHVVVNLVNHQDGRIADLSDNHKKLQVWALEYSKEYEKGKDYTPQREANARKREEGQRTKYAEQQLREKGLIRQLYEYSDNGQSFAAALKHYNLHLAHGDRRGLVVVNEQGKAYSLTRQLDKQSRKDVEQKLGDLSALPASRDVQKEQAKIWEERHARIQEFNEKSSEMKEVSNPKTETPKGQSEPAEIWSREDYHVEQNRRDYETKPESKKEAPKQAERATSPEAEQKENAFMTWINGAWESSNHRRRQQESDLDQIAEFERGKWTAYSNLREGFSLSFSENEHEADKVIGFRSLLDIYEKDISSILEERGNLHDQGQHTAVRNTREAFEFYYPLQEPTQSKIKSTETKAVEETQSEAEKRREANEVEQTDTKGKKIIAPYQKAGEREDIGKDASGRDLSMDKVRAKEEARRLEEERLFKAAAGIKDPEERRQFIRRGMLAHYAKEKVPDMIKDAAERRAEDVIKAKENPYAITPEQREKIKRQEEADYWKGLKPYNEDHLKELDRRQALERDEAQQLGRQEDYLRKYYGLDDHEARIKDLTEQYNKASGRKAASIAEELEAEKKTFEQAKNLIAYQQEKLKQQQLEKRPEWANDNQRSEHSEITDQYNEQTRPLTGRERNIDAENTEYIQKQLRGGQDREMGYEP